MSESMFDRTALHRRLTELNDQRIREKGEASRERRKSRPKSYPYQKSMLEMMNSRYGVSIFPRGIVKNYLLSRVGKSRSFTGRSFNVPL